MGVTTFPSTIGGHICLRYDLIESHLLSREGLGITVGLGIKNKWRVDYLEG